MGIDQVSQAIGELQAEAKASQKQHRLLFNKINQVADQVADLTSIVKINIETTNMRLTKIEERQDNQGEDIGKLNGFRNRFYIGLAAATGSGGFIGAILGKLGFGNGIAP